MSFRDEYIQETVTILKQRHDVTLGELIDAYTGSVSVPATIFSSPLTPFETICTYLKSIKQYTEKQIGKLLQRRTSSVKAALENAQLKKIFIEEDTVTPYRIPLTAFQEKLSPAETIVYSLTSKYGLKNAAVARILGKDPRNTHLLLQRAKKKRGDTA